MITDEQLIEDFRHNLHCDWMDGLVTNDEYYWLAFKIDLGIIRYE